MTKITPEFKRAFRHYVDGAGRMGLLTEIDVINMQSVLFLETEGTDGIGDLPYYDDDYWADEYSQFDVVRGFRKAFDYVYVRDIELLRAHGQAITVDAVRGLLDKYADIMDGELDAAYVHGLLMMPPALREELARSDAERQAIREKRADYWHRVSADLLKLFRNFDREEDGDSLTLSRLREWTENACAYWATQQALHGRQPAEDEGRKLYKAYSGALYESRCRWEEGFAAERGIKPRRVAIAPPASPGAEPIMAEILRVDAMPFESLRDIMAAFCAAYSHGIDPYTGERPRLPKD